MCEINTTPLIDVMLVLLVTLIVSLPMMTHAVRLDMPQGHPAENTPPSEVVDLDIDFDGTVVWNGTPLANLQPRRTKYGVVAQVLASAQRNRMAKIGVVNTAEFQD